MYWISTATVRVVYRGYHYAYAYGGVSDAYAHNDASSSYTYVGSRLAFRGKIVRADRKSTRLNSSHSAKSRMPSSA